MGGNSTLGGVGWGKGEANPENGNCILNPYPLINTSITVLLDGVCVHRPHTSLDCYHGQHYTQPDTPDFLSTPVSYGPLCLISTRLHQTTPDCTRPRCATITKQTIHKLTCHSLGDTVCNRTALKMWFWSLPFQYNDVSRTRRKYCI